MREKYPKELLVEVVSRSYSFADVMRELDIKYTGGNYSHLTRKVKEFEIDVTHFDRRRYCGGGNKKTAEQVLIVLPRHSKRPKHTQLRRALLETGRIYACEHCNCSGEWQGNPLILEIDHISGDWLDNRPNNLRFLCPNCHQQVHNKAT